MEALLQQAIQIWLLLILFNAKAFTLTTGFGFSSAMEQTWFIILVQTVQLGP
jgi:Holliday junction resolvasome RuvABC DNA-binding subunit